MITALLVAALVAAAPAERTGLESGLVLWSQSREGARISVEAQQDAGCPFRWTCKERV